MNRVSMRSTAICAVTALAAVGCSPVDSDLASEDPNEVAVITASESTADDESEEDVPEATSEVDDTKTDELGSPIANLLGFRVPGIDEVDQSGVTMESQEAIAECMRAEGFQYIAWVDDPSEIHLPVDPNISPTSREFAEKYGFGASTQFYSQEDVGPELVGHSGDGSGVVFSENPNERIVQAMDEPERIAYEMAFWGPDSPLFSGEAPESNRDFFNGGCFGKGQEVLDGAASEFLDTFAVEIESMSERIYSDARYLDFMSEVSECVASEGYDFYQPGTRFIETLAYFDEQLFDIDQDVGGDPFLLLTESELASLSATELDALYDAPRDIPAAAKEQLTTLQALEIDVAVAAWDCGATSANEALVVAEVGRDIQLDFIDENEDRLAAFIDQS